MYYKDNANLRDLKAGTDLVILLKLDSNHRFFGLYDLEICWMTLENNRAHLLCYIKLCASFQSHWWIQTGFTVLKRPIRVKIGDFLSRVIFDGWPCALPHRHMWIQTGVAVRKRQNWVLISVTLNFDHWPWPFAWTLLLSLVITFDKFHNDNMRGT